MQHWIDVRDGIPPSEAWSYAAKYWPELDSTQAMNLGLEPYKVRVEFHGYGDDYSAEVPTPDLYSAMALQLFNLVVEDLPIRRCANERCGRRFVRQIGRVEYGQWRTEGVKYCTNTCARAQAQREYRRRIRKEQR